MEESFNCPFNMDNFPTRDLDHLGPKIDQLACQILVQMFQKHVAVCFLCNNGSKETVEAR